MRRTCAALAVGLLLLLGAPPGSGWAMDNGDARNTGSYPFGAIIPDTQRWRAASDGFIQTTPIVAEGLVVVGTSAGLVQAFGQARGDEAWRFDMGQPVSSTPVVDSGRLFVIDEGGDLVALDLATGTSLGTVKVAPSKAPLTLHEGKLFLGTETGEVVALTTSLDILWRFKTTSVKEDYTLPANATLPTTCGGGAHPGKPIRTAPGVHDGHVIVGGMDHYVYALDEGGMPDGTTTLLWSAKLGDIILGSPVIDHATGRVFVVSYDATLRAFPVAPAGEGLNICIGHRPAAAWSAHVAGPYGNARLHATPTLLGDLFVAGNSGRLAAIDPATGATRWSHAAPAGIQADPAATLSYVVFAATDGTVRWLDPSTGARLHETKVGPGPLAVVPDALDTYVALPSELVRLGRPLPPPPDLRVDGLGGDAGAVWATVSNHGRSGSEPTNVTFYDGGTRLGAVEVQSLQLGAQATFRLDVALDAGLRVVRAHVDPDAVLRDASHEDNVAEAGVYIPGPEAVPAEVPGNATGNATGEAAGNATSGPLGLSVMTWAGIGLGVVAVALAAAAILLKRRKGAARDDEEDDEAAGD